jgi:hypothetical protein|tara:strand:- start:110 stop:448 length:339 start_codon:yes stop_codon:yes gene_type:complete
MRKLIVLIALFVFASSYSQEYTVLHINSNWNYRNDYKDLNKIEGARIVKALLEDQKPSIRSQIKAVPVIFIYKDRSIIGRWDADISLSIKAPVEELQSIIDKSKYTRVATND